MKYKIIYLGFFVMCFIIAIPYIFSTDIVVRQLGGSIIWFFAMLAIVWNGS